MIVKDYYKQLHTHKFYIRWNGPIPQTAKITTHQYEIVNVNSPLTIKKIKSVFLKVPLKIFYTKMI